MQSKNAISIVHMTAGMCGVHKLYVCYLEHIPGLQINARPLALLFDLNLI